MVPRDGDEEGGPTVTSPRPSRRGEGRGRRWTTLGLVGVGVALRWWDLGGPRLTFDEAFTATFSRLGASELFDALRANDSHPPLDYLVRHLVADDGAFWLRAPSAALSTVTLLLIAWWMRDRDWFGVAVIGFTSVSAFQILYAHQARMYALGILAGTVCAVAADRWRSGDVGTRWLVAVSAATAVGMLSQSSFAVLVPFLVLVVGRSRSTTAWRWRAAIVAGCIVWALVWGVSFLSQASQGHATWIPFTDARGVLGVVNGFVSFYGSTAVVVTLVVIGGGFAVWRVGGELRAVWLLLAGGPFVVIVLLGFEMHVLLTRTLAFSAWAIPVALAAAVELARRRSEVLGLTAAVPLVALSLLSLGAAVTYEEDSTPARDVLVAEVEQGDAVIVHPRWLWPLAVVDLDTAYDREIFPDIGEAVEVPAVLEPIDGYVDIVGNAPFTGRVWLLLPNTYFLDPEGLRTCVEQPPPPGGDYLVQCFEVVP